MKHPLLVRAVAVVLIAVALIFPLALIRGKVLERQATAEGVVNGFASETSGPQVVTGPFLALTCEETFVDERVIKRAGKDETISEVRTRDCPTAYFAPRAFDASVDLPVESLHRGIYPIRIFRAALQWQGEVEWPSAPEASSTAKRKWKQAFLVTKIRDPRGVKSLESSIPGSLLDPALPGFTIRQALGEFEGRKPGTRIPFSYRAVLSGLGSFQVTPVGDVSEIRIKSNWPHPSFSRGWSPDERRLGPGGFTATWRVNSVATGGNAAWTQQANKQLLDEAGGAGVSLFDPVNVYSLSYRAAEYGFLFVLFTFAALAMTEALAKVRVHPVQYLLVGSALAAFFLLLLALSEHIPFIQAYAGSSAACALLIAFYLRAVLGSIKRAAAYFTGLLAMYGTLYGMLQSEDNALLIGSLLVFALLAVVMVGTRRIDWNEWAPRLAARPAP